MARYYVHAPTKGVLAHIGSVLTPRMTRTYAGWSSRGQIYGQPGTQAVPIFGVMEQPGPDLASVGISHSHSAPNVIYPALYWEAAPPTQKEKAPISVFSDNQMPIPARRAPNVLKSDPYRARKGGQRQVYQPQVVQTWRGMKGTANG